MDPVSGDTSWRPQGGVGLRTPPGCRLLAHLRPGNGRIEHVTSLQGREAILEVLEALEKLGVALGVEKNAGETPALGDVEDLIALPERVELAAEPRAEILSGDDPWHPIPYVELYVEP